MITATYKCDKLINKARFKNQSHLHTSVMYFLLAGDDEGNNSYQMTNFN